MKSNFFHTKNLSKKTGFTLVTAMTFLFALLLLALASSRSGMMQERMVGNSKDVNLAFQAAEAALRDAEMDVMNNLTPNTLFTTVCDNGLCLPATMQTPASTTPIWDSIDWENSNNIRSYGQYTGSSNLPDVYAQPKYIIEKLSSIGASTGESIGMGVQPVITGQAYRITVLAIGARNETRVTLQSIFSKR